jgi:putative (di)nucleoside polyphosphate hydrolase
MSNKVPQKYRAQVGAVIFNKNKEFLLLQNVGYPDDLWDFPKGGMEKEELPEDTLQREIKEELGELFKYKIVRRAWWNDVYEWPKDKQTETGLRGQARISYWVMYQGGELNIDDNEITNYKWVNETELESCLTGGGWMPHEVSIILQDWQDLKTKFISLFE